MSAFVRCDYCGAERSPYDHGTWTEVRRYFLPYGTGFDETVKEEHMCHKCTASLATIRQQASA